MEHEFDVFETLPDRSVRWRACIRGIQPALTKLRSMSKLTANEVFAIDITTQKIIGRINEGSHAHNLDASPKMDQSRLTDD